MQKLQLEKLKKQVKYCYDNSYFYRRKIEQAGIKKGTIGSFDEFRRIPPTDKDEHKESQAISRKTSGHSYGEFVCAPLEKVIEISSTSGTSGEPTFYLSTLHDINVTNELWARAYWRAGIRPGDTVLHAFGMSMVAVGPPVIQALKVMGARPVPVGAEGGTTRILEMAEMTKPSAMITTPALAEYLIEKAPEIIKKEVGRLGIKRIVCTGAPGAGLPDVRKKIEEAYGCKLYDSIGGGWGAMYISCDSEEYQGMHSVSDDYHIWYDLVDSNTKELLALTDGVRGEGIYTVLEWESAPPLRYAMKDVLQFETSPCPCGLPGFRLRVLGRADDMIIIKGVNVYPTAIKNVVNSFFPGTTGELRVVLGAPGPLVNPPLKLKIEYGEGTKSEEIERLKKELEETMHSKLKFRPYIVMLPPNSLQRAAGPASKGILIEKAYDNKKNQGK
ncbi:MAG: phenylacetate--CoA ligase family protein [Thermodesulfobacteriota bacterium]|nr:phenylacetate--CoA ligase family protein [Thermodesulfobacteriota bacterium]